MKILSLKYFWNYLSRKITIPGTLADFVKVGGVYLCLSSDSSHIFLADEKQSSAYKQI
jgi:hypothetical protein